VVFPTSSSQARRESSSSRGTQRGLAGAVATALSRPEGFYEPGLADAAERASWPRYAAEVLRFVRAVRGE
jgi:hypothetical protein